MTEFERALPVRLQGLVVKGFGRGSKQLGIPTANFDPHVVDELPHNFPCGIYYGWARLESDRVEKMVASVGWNPHFKDVKKKTIETHIMHEYTEDFYGSNLKIILTGYIRPERKFIGLEDLIEEIHNDIKIAKKKLDDINQQELKDDSFLK